MALVGRMIAWVGCMQDRHSFLRTGSNTDNTAESFIAPLYLHLNLHLGLDLGLDLVLHG